MNVQNFSDSPLSNGEKNFIARKSIGWLSSPWMKDEELVIITKASDSCSTLEGVSPLLEGCTLKEYAISEGLAFDNWTHFVCKICLITSTVVVKEIIRKS